MYRAVLILVVVFGGCKGEEARREGERATAEAERIAETTTSETTLTGATIETDSLRAEQAEYRRNLRSALDTVEKNAQVESGRGAGHRKVLAGRRETLKQWLDAIDRSTHEDWAALKAKIDRDLDASGGR